MLTRSALMLILMVINPAHLPTLSVAAVVVARTLAGRRDRSQGVECQRLDHQEEPGFQ